MTEELFTDTTKFNKGSGCVYKDLNTLCLDDECEICEEKDE